MRGKSWFLLVSMTLLAALLLSACELTLPATVTVPEEPAPDVVAETVQAKLTQIAISTLVMQLTEVKNTQTAEAPLVVTEVPKAVEPTATTQPTLAPTATLQPTATLPPTATSTQPPTATASAVPVIQITPVAYKTPTKVPTSYYVPSKTPTTVAPTPIVCYRARYIADVSIPDNTVLSPGQAFVKTWRLKNDGTCVWTTAFDFINTSGGSLGGPAVIDMPAAVNPGGTIDVSVSMVAPASEGTYTSYWQVRTDGGTRFGWGAKADGGFWVRIKVED